MRMRASIKVSGILLLLIAMTGCVAHSRYNWCDYDTKMYSHYKNPAQREAFVQGLKEIIEEAEPEGKVPPGIYAEYGFALYEEGNHQEAIAYFKKEADKWPESRVFMTKLIAIAGNRAHAQKENAGASPETLMHAEKDRQKSSAEGLK